MKVKPLATYRQPKYPRMGEQIEPANSALSRNKQAALVAAILAVSGTLTGCGTAVSQVLGGPAGAPPMRQYLSEQEIIQILQYEAETLGVSLGEAQGKVVKYFDNDVALDFHDEGRQFGVAVIDRTESTSLYESLKMADEQNCIDSIRAGGTLAEGSLEDEQPVNFFLVSDIDEREEEQLRQTFREFIEWLQSEGII